jgi:hypothetical protein
MAGTIVSTLEPISGAKFWVIHIMKNCNRAFLNNTSSSAHSVSLLVQTTKPQLDWPTDVGFKHIPPLKVHATCLVGANWVNS